jgi:hypothetical protein
MIVRRKGRYLSIKRKVIRDKPTKESHLLVAYLNPIKSLCIVLLLFYYYALFSYIAITPYIAIVGDLAPQVDLLSSIKDDTFDTYSIPLKVETR